MPPKPIVEKKTIQQEAVALIRREGIAALNARRLGEALGCSTKPLFRVYENMDALKKDVMECLDHFYNAYMEQRMDKENRLLTQSIAYVEFAREEPEVFYAMFLAKSYAGWRVRDVLDAEWNRETIENVKLVLGLEDVDARFVFRDMWLYAHGLAAQLVLNRMELPESEVKDMIRHAYQRFSAIK